MAVELLAPSKIDVIEDIEALSSNSGPSQAELAIFLLLLSWLCLLFVCQTGLVVVVVVSNVDFVAVSVCLSCYFMLSRSDCYRHCHFISYV